MHDGWSARTLGSVLRLQYGKAIRESDRITGGVPVVGSAGRFDWHDRGNATTGAGSIVVGRKGTAGSVTWFDGPVWATDTAYWVELASGDVDFRYLFLLLQGSDLPSVCAQTGVPGLNRDRAYEIPVRIPPLPAQRRIVDLMSALDETIAAAEANLRAAESSLRHFPSGLQSRGHAQGWEARTLSEVLGDPGAIRTGPFGSQLHQKDYLPGGPVAVVMPVNMVNGRADLVAAAKISQEDAQRLSRHLTRAGDILWSRRGDVTRFVVIDDSSAGSLCGTGCFLLRPRERDDTAWLEVLLSSPETGRWLVDHAVGATMANLNRDILGKIPVLVPPAEQREGLAHSWTSLREVERKNLATIANLGVLRSNLLTVLLSGVHEIPDSYEEVMEAS